MWIGTPKQTAAQVFPRTIPTTEPVAAETLLMREGATRIRRMGAVSYDNAHACHPRPRGAWALEFPVATVQRAALFHGLKPNECLEVAATAQVQRYARQETVFREDDPVRQVFVVASGRVKVAQVTSCGKEVILRVDGSGQLVDGFGTASRVYSSTARAMDSCLLLTWELGTFDALVRRFPVIQSNATDIFSNRLKAMERRFCDVSTKRVPQRLARILIETADQGSEAGDANAIGLSREELAQMTGSSLFTVSRLLSEWAELGIVYVDRRAVVIEQLPHLIALAEDTVLTQRVGDFTVGRRSVERLSSWREERERACGISRHIVTKA